MSFLGIHWLATQTRLLKTTLWLHSPPEMDNADDFVLITPKSINCRGCFILN